MANIKPDLRSQYKDLVEAWVCNIGSSMCQTANLYRRVTHRLVANSELSGHSKENSGLIWMCQLDLVYKALIKQGQKVVHKNVS